MASILFNIFLLDMANRLSLKFLELTSENERLRGEHGQLLKELNELRSELEALRADYDELGRMVKIYYKAFMFLGNKSIILKLNVSAPYEKGFKFSIIEVRVPLWKYALYRTCGDLKRLSIDPYNDTVLHEVVGKVHEWLVEEGILMRRGLQMP